VQVWRSRSCSEEKRLLKDERGIFTENRSTQITRRELPRRGMAAFLAYAPVSTVQRAEPAIAPRRGASTLPFCLTDSMA
jgi:hypothetical protein